MAPGQPIPSSAALNALRGLVFTTSCSVVILAEERRRRLNVARTAVENARKLRNAKAKLRQSDLSPRRIESASHSQPTTHRRRKRPRTSPSLSTSSRDVSIDSNINDLNPVSIGPHRQTPKPTPRLPINLTVVPTTWSYHRQSALYCDTSTSWGSRTIQNTSRPLHNRYFTTTASRRQVQEAIHASHHPSQLTAEPAATHPWPNIELYHPNGAIPLQSFYFETHLLNCDLGLLIHDEIQRILLLAQKTKNSKDADRVRYTELNKFADQIMRTRSAIDLDATIRYLVATQGLRIQGEWFHKIFEFYAQCPDPRPMLSWLPFCLEQNFFLRPQEMARFYNRCRHHWGFSGEDVDKVYASLAAINDGIAKPSTISIQPKETWKDAYIRNSRKLMSQKSWKSSPDAGIFFVMEKAAKDQDWDLVWNTFQKSQSDMSAPCFRLAVLARVELDRGRTGATKKLVWSRAPTHDVSSAITPLLMAQLDEGADPRALIADTLQRGATIPDMVYNTAARRALGTEGSAQDAIDICYDAARNNGKNDLLYTLFNLRNLAWGFARMSNYPALEELLDSFMSLPKPYPSNQTRVCREAFKHIMKSLARRAFRANTEVSSAEHARLLDKVNQALVHCGGVSKASDAGWANCSGATIASDVAPVDHGIPAQREIWQVTSHPKELAIQQPAAATKSSGTQAFSKSPLTRSGALAERRSGSINFSSESSNPESLDGRMSAITAQINILLAALQKETDAITYQSHSAGWQGDRTDHSKRVLRTPGDRGSGPIQADNKNRDKLPQSLREEKAAASA